MMQLGFASAILPEQTLEEVFAIASQLNYDCVEVMCWPPGKAERRYAGVTHIDVTNLTDEKIREIQELSDRYRVSISALGYYPNPLSPDQQESETAVAHIRKLIEAAPKLGLNQVNSFIGRDWTKSIDDNWPRFLELWAPLVELAEQNSVRIGIENCPMFFSNDEWPGGKNLAISPAIWNRMFNDIPNPNFGLNYDPSHMIWQHMDYLKPLKDFSERIFHVHAKDVRIDRDNLNNVGILANPLEYHTPKLPGMGDVNWGQFFSILGDSGYDGPVCVEVEDRVYEGSLGSRCQSLQQSCTYLRNYIPNIE